MGHFFTLYVIHYIGITQRSHDHLFQKSRQLGATWVHKQVKQAKIDKFNIFPYDCQIGYMGQFVHIICNSLYWYHTEAS